MNMRMKSNIKILATATLFLLLISGCQKEWNEHYNMVPETVNRNIWVDLQEDENISLFVNALIEMQYDTLFDTDDTYTLFIPNNNAFSQYLDTAEITNSILDYHISRHFIQGGRSSHATVIQTLAEKYVTFDNTSSPGRFDGIPTEYDSPLFLNGRYFILGDLSLPRDNLYEYFVKTNPILQRYIDNLDSIIIDKEESIPIGITDKGETIYDTVAIIYNEFEEFYFPIREEFREKTATIVFPKEEDYFSALDMLASDLDAYSDHTEIPMEWQEDVLIPYLLDHGVFANKVEDLEFIFTGVPGDTLKLKNILGDSIAIDYQVDEKTLCSNGYAYNYRAFEIPDTLVATTRFEGEWLLEKTGSNKFAWFENVDVQSSVSFEPQQVYTSTASNDSIIYVGFSYDYNGDFSVEFKVDKLFPREYLMVVKTSMTLGGIFNVYFNDDLVKTIDSYDFVLNPWYHASVRPGRVYWPESGFINYDCWIDNENEYGAATVRFEYVGAGSMPSQGLIFDYIDFIPKDRLE
jgi:hypothetical protein